MDRPSRQELKRCWAANSRAHIAPPCRYSHAALVKDWRLVWGALPLISRGAQPPAALTTVRVKSPPPFASILAHLQAVSPHPDNNPDHNHQPRMRSALV